MACPLHLGVQRVKRLGTSERAPTYTVVARPVKLGTPRKRWYDNIETEVIRGGEKRNFRGPWRAGCRTWSASINGSLILSCEAPLTKRFAFFSFFFPLQGGADPPFVVAVETEPAGEVRCLHGAAVHQPRREFVYPPSLSNDFVSLLAVFFGRLVWLC